MTKDNDKKSFKIPKR